jgi:hypothetical protein
MNSAISGYVGPSALSAERPTVSSLTHSGLALSHHGRGTDTAQGAKSAMNSLVRGF